MAVDVFIPSVDAMQSACPLSSRNYIISDRIYAISLTDKVVAFVFREGEFCIVFCDGLPTVKCSIRRHQKRIVREERGQTSRIAPIECLIILHSQRTNLLFGLWIDRVFFLGEGWCSKTDCQR
jgi:hypothetical protein